jgi:hypothetical protein
MNRLACACVVLLAAGVAPGDDKKPEPKGVEVSGRVTLDGKPLPAGVLTFTSKDGKTTVATKIVDGKYETRLPEGEYGVGIAPPKDKKGPVIPAKYGDPKTSGIIYTVKAGKQAFDLNLTSK